EIVNAVDNGALVVNYFGHGGEDGLAVERILLKPDVNGFRNYCKLNCFVTVTCEFTRFDNPFRETAGEFTYWNKQAGAISLITTTRQIFVSFAVSFNNTLGKYLFSYSDDDAYDDNEYPSMAEALRLAKSDPKVSGINQKRLIFFIGDPAMKLAFSKPNIRLTKINDVPLAQATDTLKALSYVKLAGEVTDVSGNLLPNYNGTLSTTIYDKLIDRRTLANDGTRLNGELVILDFETLGEIIFRGQSTVKNGQFEFDFVVPKDIGIPVGFGKVSFYSKNEELSLDQSGASINTLKIGGINENAAEDNTGPVITLYMNDENFVSGGITNEQPTLLAKLEDLNGINTASGIGHDIVAILDGDETNPVILNDYYQTEIDDYTKGTVSFPFRELEPGLHTLTLKAWDVYNNSSISEIQFIVFDKDQELAINNVLNYPNPFVNYTEFWFNHNSSEPLDVSIQIFTVSGKLVKTINGQTTGGFKSTSSLSRDLIWDGRDDFGDKIGKGVYVYKLTVRSNILNKKVEKIEKLVIL
ncbi:MAG: type IX secretion system sortase PorU, partial [Flaviramulus sp.]